MQAVPETSQRQPPEAATALPSVSSPVLHGCVLFLAWGGMIAKLTTDWSTNSQYEFGFFVPLFIVYLLSRRWDDRPNPSKDGSGLFARLILTVALVALFPIRVIQEANPDWRPLNWVHAAIVVTLTVAMFARVGGAAWVGHFIWPLALVFFCLPWPLVLEQAAIKYLTGAVTGVTVEVLNSINIPALQRGNVIELAAGSVGVAEACSGMRSLAGTLMASAFFGEYYRLFWAKRVALIFGGILIAFTLNLCRTFFLGWRTAAEGTGAVDAWHDPAGYTIFLISFALLWLLSKAIADDQNFTQRPGCPSRQRTGLSPLVLLVSCIWLLAAYGLTEAWYRFREGRRNHVAEWRLQWPAESASFRYQNVPDEVRSILRFSEATSGVMNWPDGLSWHVYALTWEPGRASAQLATMHRPEICMPAAGFKMVEKTEPVTIPIGDSVLTFDGSVFDASNSLMYVYRCLWEDQVLSGAAQGRRFDMSISGRLQSAWYGRRNLGQKLVQIGVSGAANEAEARKHLEDRLPELITSGV